MTMKSTNINYEGSGREAEHERCERIQEGVEERLSTSDWPSVSDCSQAVKIAHFLSVSSLSTISSVYVLGGLTTNK